MTSRNAKRGEQFPKVVVVTGASAGVGRATARAFAEGGADVALLARGRLGYVWGTMAALKRMRPRDKGVIVQVGSALAYRGVPLQSAYCGAKHAIQGLNDSLRSELLHDRSNVRVCMVQMPALPNGSESTTSTGTRVCWFRMGWSSATMLAKNPMAADIGDP
jgi:NADP-dependent 3-hydroxy acid dehydrogenase YdfG